ncbi:helix-turn-helix transcriptional regulator [Glycomyces harbinensis]|uniref:Transcriptional regulator, AlpA family n=2 Tax=Glycomyces harbinensis TaxID=58114 RepID=A0A1G6YUW2_9ACTN|nr:helix-turn-helix domain-containing protein [Glycomyces harbinensis]SDD94120.1 transcriptional regulator, AlpA family [Glycomyces harbinensis]
MTRATAHPTPSHPTKGLMTLQEVYDELGISKSTWNDWKNKGRAPKHFKLPNGQVRVRRADYDKWLATLELVSA